MKKLIFILFAFLAISTATAQPTSNFKTIKLTALSTGGSNDDILTIGADKVVKKVSKSSIAPDISGKENTIAPGTTSQYWRGDKTWQEFPAPNIYPLQINTTKNTVWNNGNGSVYSNTSFGQHALRSNQYNDYLSYPYSGNYNTAYGYTALMENTSGVGNTAFGAGALSSNVLGSYNTAIGSKAGYYWDNGISGLENSNNSVFIGSRCFPGGTTYGQCTNVIVIGANAEGAGSNTATLGNTDIVKTVLRGTINTTSMPVYADNAAATAGGLLVGDQYRTSTGVLMVRY